jgi:dCTP deaminase
VNPKSSSGRIFLMVRAVADGVDMYDALVRSGESIGGWRGELWVLVRPEVFPVLLAPGIALSQLRLFSGKSFLDSYEMNREVDRQGLLFDRAGKRIKLPRRHTDSFFLTLSVKEHIGWECRGSHKVLDLAKGKGSYDPTDFFEPITAHRGMYKLRKGSHYILGTSERLLVPPHLSAELRAVEVRFFDGRVHAAGYIDPGWGHDAGSGTGRPITLEVMPHENLCVSDEQNIGRVRYERMKAVPETLYDAGNSSYSGQEGATLAKWFKKT